MEKATAAGGEKHLRSAGPPGGCGRRIYSMMDALKLKILAVLLCLIDSASVVKATSCTFVMLLV